MIARSMDRKLSRTAGFVLAFLSPLCCHAQSASSILDKAIAAEKSHPAQSVLIQTTSTITGKVEHNAIRLIQNRNQKRFLIVGQGTGQNRVYFIDGSKLVVYDRSLNQYLERELPAGSSLGSVLIQELKITPALELAIDPAAADAAVMGKLREIKDWKVSKSGGLITLSHSIPGKAEIRAAFAVPSGLPALLYFSSNGRYDRATFTYSAPPAKVWFSPPSGAHEVISFETRHAPPTFNRSDAATVARACAAAYSRIRSLQFQVSEGGYHAKISWQGLLASQDDGTVAWAFDGKYLEILNRKKKVFSKGQARPESIGAYLQPLGVRMDPMLRALLNGENTLTSLYAPGMTGRLVGKITLKGVPCDLLELSAAGVRIQLRIRTDNHLIAEFVTEDLDRSGAVISESDRVVDYLLVGKRLPASAFRLSVSLKAKPLATP